MNIEIEANKAAIKTILCFHKPIFKTLIHVFSELYTKDVSMYSFLSSSEDILKSFTHYELALLSTEKRPSYLNLCLLYKVREN